jgi:hypothetical protein
VSPRERQILLLALHELHLRRMGVGTEPRDLPLTRVSLDDIERLGRRMGGNPHDLFFGASRFADL